MSEFDRDRWASALEKTAKSWRASAEKVRSGDNRHLIATKCIARAEENERWARCLRANETPEEEIARLRAEDVEGVA